MAAAFPLLHPPVEDSMEMSSPADRALDDDIDIDEIDYDFGSGGVAGQEDDQMQEDITRPSTANDEMMQEYQASDVGVPEEEMGDDDNVYNEQDDELIDFEDEVPAESLDQTIPEMPTEMPQGYQEPDTQQEQAGVIYTEESEIVATSANPETVEKSPARLTPPLEPVGPHVVGEGASSHALQNSADDRSAKAGIETKRKQSTAGEQSEEHTATTAVSGESAETHQNVGQELTAHDEVGEQQDIEAGDDQHEFQAPYTEGDGEDVEPPSTPTDTGLHPMIVQFSGYEMPLFKSQNQPDGLLKDDNLASLSLSELIQNVRPRLTVKTGEDISDDQELVLGFEGLGCFLVENSRPTFETSLNDVLEVFLQLNNNDGVEEIPPLCLSFSLQLKFSSHLAAMKQAAAGGQGMSAFAYLHFSTNETVYEEQYPGNLDAGPISGDAKDPHYEMTSALGQDESEHQEGEPQVDSYEHYTGTSEQGYDPDQNEDEYYHHPEGEPEEANPLDQEDAQASHEGEPEQGINHEDQSQGKFTESSEFTTGQDMQSRSANTTLHEAGEQEDAHEPSNASSSTVRGDDQNDFNGEYIDYLSDDEIDWDAETVLTSCSEQAQGEEDDFATFVNESGVQSETYKSEEIVEKQHVQLGSELEYNAHAAADEDAAHANDQGSDQGDQYNEDHDQNGEDGAFTDPGEEPLDSNFFTDALHDESYQEEDEDLDSITAKADVTEPAAAEDEDSIDFDDDTEEQHAARKASEGNTLTSAEVAGGGSPNGKRSYDDHADEDDIDFDSPQVKKFKAE